jgi:chromosome segregation ATPase
MSEPTIEERATAMGWQPKESFKGDPARWADAETYVERGESLLPIVKAQNRELRDQVSALKGNQSRLEQTVKESQDAIKALTEIHTEATMRAAKDRKRELVTAIETARKEGQVDAVVELTEQLDEHQAAITAAAVKPVEKKVEKPPTETETPEWKAWTASTPWWQTDTLKTDLQSRSRLA